MIRSCILFALFLLSLQGFGSNTFIASFFEDSLSVEKKMMLYSHPVLMNQWSLTENPAGQLFFEPEERISRATSALAFEDEPLRRAMDPGETRSLFFQTQSKQQVGNVKVNGIFGYQNQQYKDLMYNGVMDFRHNRNLYTLGDTIGGKQRQEGYFFLAEMAYPMLDGRLFTGIRMNYESAIGAKMQDLRNRSTIARAKFTPGLVYNHDNFSIGLSGGYTVETNMVNVRAELDERHTLFYHMGMGHYSASGNFTGTETVRYEGSGYRGGLQLSHSVGGFAVLHSFDYGHLNTEALVGSSYRLINGITDYDRLAYQGSLLWERQGSIHHIGLNASAEITNATEVRQQTHSQPVDGVFYTIIRTIRWIEGKHIVNDYAAGVDYHFMKKGSSRPLQYQIKASANARLYEATHYPVQNYGFYNATSLTSKLEYQHFFRLNGYNIDPHIAIGGRFVIDSDAVFIPFPNYIDAIPELDFRYFSENCYLIKLGFDISTKRFPIDRFSTVFMNIEGSYMIFPDLEDLDQGHNLNMRLSLGFLF